MVNAGRGLNPNTKAKIEAQAKRKSIFANDKQPLAAYDDAVDSRP